jgi:hypothetical protein
MKTRNLLVIALVVLSGVVSVPARAAGPVCQKVSGKLFEIPIDTFVSPGDPFGRTVVTIQGVVNGIGTGILTSVGPGLTPGTLGATTRHVFVTGVGDQLVATGSAVLTPIPNTPNVTDVVTFTITGGLGKYAGARGTIVATGIGLNFFPLPPGPSAANNSSFEFQLDGELCGIR